MSRFRNHERFRRRYISKEGRRRRSMVSVRIQDGTDEQGRAVLIGRSASDGSLDSDVGERFAPVGLFGRPAVDAVVESLVVHVGGNPDHPVEANTLDRRRQVIIDAVGLDLDETVVYTSKGAIKIDRDGMVLVGPVEEFSAFDALVTRREFNDAMARMRDNHAALREHRHPTPQGPSDRPAALTLADPVDAEGTAFLKAR